MLLGQRRQSGGDQQKKAHDNSHHNRMLALLHPCSCGTLKQAPKTADIPDMTAILARISIGTRLLILAIAWVVAVEGTATAAPSLLFGSALGGSQSDTIRAIATDVSQNIYVVGETYSTDFPGPASSSSARRAGDAFVAKLNSSGTQILYCVILSGEAFRIRARGSA